MIAATSWFVASLAGCGAAAAFLFFHRHAWRTLFAGAELIRTVALLLMMGLLLDHLVGLLTGSLAAQEAIGWAGLVAFIAVIGFIVIRRRELFPPTSRATGGDILQWVLLLAAMISIALAILAEPLRDWDARSVWFFHAKAIMLDGGFHPSAFWDNGEYDWSHKYYPKLVSMLAARAAEFVAGGWNEYAPKVALIPLYAAGIVGLGVIGGSVGRTFLLLIGASAFLGSQQWNGYVDGFLALFATTAAGALIAWVHDGDRRNLVLGLATIGIALCVKEEGMIFFLLLAPLIVYGVTRHPDTLSVRNIPLVLLLAPYGVWTWLKQDIPSSRIIESGSVMRGVFATLSDPSALAYKVSYLVTYTAEHTALFPLLAAYGVIVACLGVTVRRLLWGVLALVYTLGLGAVYLGTPADFVWHVGTSLDRVALLPSLLLWTGIVTMIPALTTAHRPRAAQIQPSPLPDNSCLSVLIPVYNERATIAHVLAAVCDALPAVDKDIILVDDCSSDGTTALLKKTFGGVTGPHGGAAPGADGDITLLPPRPGQGQVTFRTLFHEHNRGKGAALRTAMAAAAGDVIVIQDADLEYDPRDWTDMYDLIARKKVADVVYGSRFYGRSHRSLFFHHYMANRLISLLFNLLYNQTLSDIEVCYKMFTRQVLDAMSLTCDDFGIEVEISAQIARQRKIRIYETAISYYGRTYDEGKKISWRDGLKALWYLVKFRL